MSAMDDDASPSEPIPDTRSHESVEDQASLPLDTIAESLRSSTQEDDACELFDVDSIPDRQISPPLDLSIVEAKAAIAARMQLVPDELDKEDLAPTSHPERLDPLASPANMVPLSISSLLDAKAIITAQTALQATADAQNPRAQKAKLSRDHPVVESISGEPPASTMVQEESATPPTISAQVVVESTVDVLERERARFRQEVRDTVHAEAVHAVPVNDIPSGPSSAEQSRTPRRIVSAVAVVVVLVLVVTISVLVTRPSSDSPSTLPSSTLTTLAPSMAPLVILPDGRIAFTNTLQLRQAADAYMAESVDTVADSNVSQVHGYPIGTWDVSRVTDFSRVFNADRDQSLTLNDRVQILNAFNESLSGWDVSKAVTMHGMFAGSEKFVGDSLAGWNVSRVTDFSYMFMQATAMTGNLSMWDTAGATNMDGMFYQNRVFNGDLSRWNVARVESMYRMFYEAYQFQGGDLSRWNVSRVRRMDNMFASAEDFNGNVSTWDTGNVQTMDSMFRFTAFSGDVTQWSVGKVLNMKAMFRQATQFTGDNDLKNWDTSSVTDMAEIFQGCTSFLGDVSTWDVSRVTSFENAFESAFLFNGDISQWDTTNALNMNRMFFFAKIFNGDVSSWNVEKVTSTREMFHFAMLFNGDLSGWNVSRLTDSVRMFTGSSFNHSLCRWGGILPDQADVGDMFHTSQCLNVSNPSTIDIALGPFCHNCEAAGP